jgi:hypothetical protein
MEKDDIYNRADEIISQMQRLNLENPIIQNSIFELDEEFDDYFDEEGHLKKFIPKS